MNLIKSFATAACAVALASHVSADPFPVVNSNITEAEVEAAQQAWGAALIDIGDAYRSGGIESARTAAAEVIDAAYGYKLGSVLFKPTLTTAPQTFRTTREGALAYFVGHDQEFPNDSGFALADWAAYEFENAAVLINGNLALTMGKVRLTNKDGSVTEVDKTWGFRKDDEGNLRIVLHHSSLPHAPEAEGE